MNEVELAGRLREALQAADYSYDGVVERIGTCGHDALSRNETTPGRRETTDGSPLSTLIRLFLLQVPVPLELAERALPGLIDPLAAYGVLEQSVAEVAARLDVRPYALDDGRDLWVVSDLTPGMDGCGHRIGPEHVLGISSASTSLAQLTIRRQVGTALDLGTGCGVQALHLADHADRVVATDVNARALWLTRFNVALNEVGDRVEVRDGSFFSAVRSERFDLVATNPPFVISPATGERLVYRDSGLPGDRVVEGIARGLPEHLTEGGWGQILGNWAIRRDQPWQDRLAQWLSDECDALVVQREVIDTPAYVEMWLKDSGHHGGADYHERYDTWLSWFDEQGVDQIGFGWINLHRTFGGHHELLDWPYAIEQPIAPAIGAWAEAVTADRGLSDDQVAALRPRVRPDVRQETDGRPGAEDPETIVLRQQTGFRRARPADTVLAGLVGACDGDLTVGQILAALAQLTDADADDLRRERLPQVRELLVEGFLEA